jgi:hypothetical protein
MRKSKKEKPVQEVQAEKTIIKKKRPRTLKVGIRRKTTILLWVLLLGSVTFGIYKNFTAIDIHTVHEKEVIEKRIIDTNKVESFVKNFATTYYSWTNTQESIDGRTEHLKAYLTEDLQLLNVDIIRMDIPTSSNAYDVQVWDIEQTNDTDFDVTFSVKQEITEGEAKTYVTSAYNMAVHVDSKNDMVIIKNPTISSVPTKSAYTPTATESDGTVDANTSEEITDFLNTFFKLYPTATEKELSYYVKNQVLKPIGKDYIFVELVNPVYRQVESKVNVSVSVIYLDSATKATQVSQFDLTLEKSDNWKITL